MDNVSFKDIFNKEMTVEEKIMELFLKYENENDQMKKLLILEQIKKLKEPVGENSSNVK